MAVPAKIYFLLVPESDDLSLPTLFTLTVRLDVVPTIRTIIRSDLFSSLHIFTPLTGTRAILYGAVDSVITKLVPCREYPTVVISAYPTRKLVLGEHGAYHMLFS